MEPARHSLSISCRLDVGAEGGEAEFHFRDRFAGMMGLGRRISGFTATNAADSSRKSLIVVQTGSGVYKVKLNGSREIRIDFRALLDDVPDASSDPGRYALVSSLGSEAAVILPSDLLPELGGDAPVVRIRIEAPSDWIISTTERQAQGIYEVQDQSRSVFVVGRLRRHAVNVDRSTIDVTTAGKLNVSDLQVNVLVSAIAREQIRMMSETRRGSFLVTVLPFPQPVSGVRSAAYTLGRNVIMLISPDADRERTVKLFQRHLAHELLHFYVPEALKVKENFDWFWEGFVRYEGLVALNRIGLLSSRELLDEMAREFSAYRLNKLISTTSLIGASVDKFSNGATYELVYHKGTLVAWLYDLELHSQTNGTTGVSEVIAELYKTYGHSDEPVGNREVLALLRRQGHFDRFLLDYVEGTKSIDLSEMVKGYGLEVAKGSGDARITISPRLSIKQRQALAQFVPPEGKQR